MTGPAAPHTEDRPDDTLPGGVPFDPEWEVTPRRVRRMLEERPGATVLIDCRGPAEWAVARLEGATLIPMTEIGARLDEVRALIEAAGPDAEVVTHCHLGVRSLRVAEFLRGAGVAPRARSMAGGIRMWTVDVDPGVPDYD